MVVLEFELGLKIIFSWTQTEGLQLGLILEGSGLGVGLVSSMSKFLLVHFLFTGHQLR